MRNYFLFNGEDSRAHGVYVRTPAPIVRAAERVKHIEIPGRQGDLTSVEGVGTFKPYTQNIDITVCGKVNVEYCYKWLQGGGFVTFSSDSDKRQTAYVVNAITLERLSRDLDWWKGQVSFYCQPLKESIAGDRTETLPANGRVSNNGDVEEYPVIIVYGSGDVAITVDGGEFTLNDLPDGVYTIDTEASEVIDASGELVTRLSAGVFPVFPVGISHVMWKGDNVSKVEVTRRVRFR